MSELVIQASGLRKVYRVGGRRFAAVDGLDLEVPRGGVHGFLGANGAGKTTTIRILLGLARPTSGEVHVNGMSVTTQLPGVLEGVGAVVDEPTFSPTFTARKNLLLLARSAGLGRKRVDAALEQVGLPGHSHKRYSEFSLGMKQRLAIAAALLKSPDLLILDEPTNGLDPGGIRDIRHLIQQLGESGVTVLLSSHILAEVQQVCHSVTIISEGKRVVHGRVEDLMGEDTARTRVAVADPQRAASTLQRAGFEVTHEEGRLLVTGHDHPEEITRVLAEEGLYVSDLTAVRPNLEEFFLHLTGHPLPAREHQDANGHGSTTHRGTHHGDDLDEETTHELVHGHDEPAEHPPGHRRRGRP